jgi:hypothetical protein
MALTDSTARKQAEEPSLLAGRISRLCESHARVQNLEVKESGDDPRPLHGKGGCPLQGTSASPCPLTPEGP